MDIPYHNCPDRESESLDQQAPVLIISGPYGCLKLSGNLTAGTPSQYYENIYLPNMARVRDQQLAAHRARIEKQQQNLKRSIGKDSTVWKSNGKETDTIT